MTFPKYVWAIKCCAYRWYITFQKSNMAAQKPEVCKPFVVICGSHHISSSRVHSNKIPTAIRNNTIEQLYLENMVIAVGILFLAVLCAEIVLLPVWAAAIFRYNATSGEIIDNTLNNSTSRTWM